MQGEKHPNNSDEVEPDLNGIETAPEVMPSSDRDDSVDSQQYSDEFAKKISQAERLRSQADAERTRAITELIKPSAQQAFNFMRYYCGGVFILLILDGFSFFGFSLPDNALNFLVGSTATTVIGLVGMVLTGVFLGVKR